jgi:thiamine-monophosphate kinase
MSGQVEFPRGEFQLIDWVRQRSAPHPQVPVGIGDDAALLVPTPGEEVIVTTDMLMDGRHFIVGETPPELIGRKALAVNLSDIAAMGGRPLAAFISWALPRHLGRNLAQSLFAGMAELAEDFQTSIAGGDTNSWDGPLVINVTLVGETVGQRRILRSGAQPGDVILVTGPLGGSLAGRHLTFTPRVREALELTQRVHVTSMLDLSDGIASDLRHILNQSRVGATLDAVAIPIHPDVDRQLPQPEQLRKALTDGEDFELLLTVSSGDADRLLASPPAGCVLTRIGTIDAELGSRIRTERGVEPLLTGGWEHPLD